MPAKVPILSSQFKPKWDYLDEFRCKNQDFESQQNGTLKPIMTKSRMVHQLNFQEDCSKMLRKGRC